MIKAIRVTCSGQFETHEAAKEFLAAVSGAFIDRLIETKGIDYIDTDKAKYQAKNYLDEASPGDDFRLG